MEYGLDEIDLYKIRGVFKQIPEIDKVILYGSRAKGNYKPISDIDLTLVGNELNAANVSKLFLQIDDLLLPYTFDISIFHQISNPDLVEHIERVGKVFYDKNAVYADIDA